MKTVIISVKAADQLSSHPHGQHEARQRNLPTLAIPDGISRQDDGRYYRHVYTHCQY